MLSKFVAARFFPTHVCIESGPTIEIEEKKPDAKGIISFAVKKPCLAIRNPGDKPPLAWAANGKCADGAIVIETDEGPSAHIVELKSGIGPGTWKSVKSQFEGMLLNVIAVAAAGEVPKPSAVICHNAYKKDQFGSQGAVDPILIKATTGGTSSIGITSDWHEGTVELPGYGQVELRKIQRSLSDGSGTGII